MTNETVGFLGPFGSYSHQACLEFDSNATLIPYTTIRQVLQNSLECSTIIVPYFNSTAGFVEETVNNFITTNLRINGDLTLNIRHSLLAKNDLKLEDIKRVYSHPKALGQCQLFLSAHVPNAKLVPTDSTARAAEMLDANSACIGSSNLSELYKLTILNDDITDFDWNSTRFLVLGLNKRPSNWTVIQIATEDLNTVLKAIAGKFDIRNIVPGIYMGKMYYILEIRGTPDQIRLILGPVDIILLGTL